jgi:hypothetical protein
VVLGEKQVALISVERCPKFACSVELFFYPEWASPEKRNEPPRRHTDVGLKDAFELEQRLVVEADVGQLAECDARGTQAVVDGARRESGVPLLPGEAFLLGSSQDHTIPYQAGGAVMIIGGNAENVLYRHS